MYKLNNHAIYLKKHLGLANLQAETLEIVLVVGPKTKPLINKTWFPQRCHLQVLSLQPPMRNQIFQVTQHEEDTVTVSQDTTTTTSNTTVLSIAQCATSWNSEMILWSCLLGLLLTNEHNWAQWLTAHLSPMGADNVSTFTSTF